MRDAEIVVVMDICSSTSLLEDLKASDNRERWGRTPAFMHGIVYDEAGCLYGDVYKFIGDAFSKKLSNHGHAVAVHFLHYNFARVHKSLRVTPAMEAGLTDHVWSLEEIAVLTEKAA